MKTGKIIITDKVYFESDGLPKPTGKEYRSSAWYNQDMERYEASKQLIEVENVYFHKHLRTWMFREHISHKILVKNNQSCKASIKNNKATIIELINRK